MVVVVLWVSPVYARSEAFKENIFDPGKLKPVDSVLKVAAGQLAPDFTLPSVSGERVSLSQFRGKKNVVISFVPAAWTPVCSDQWPGYGISRRLIRHIQRFSHFSRVNGRH